MCRFSFSPNPLWSEMGGGLARHEVLSSNAITFYPLRPLHIGPYLLISSFTVSSHLSLGLPLFLFLYSHLCHHSNVLFSFSSADMFIPLKSSPLHTHSNRLHFRHLLYAVICDMVFPVYLVDIPKHSHLRRTDLILFIDLYYIYYLSWSSHDLVDLALNFLKKS